MANELQKAVPIATFRELFEKARRDIEMVAPKHLDINRLIKVALVAIGRNPKLLECTQSSVLQCFMTGTQLGLDVSGVGGQAYLVPFFNNKTGKMEATFIPGYRGLLDLVRRSGQLRGIECRVVYEGDEFNLEFGLEPKLLHKPRFDGPRTNDRIKFAYSIARLESGEISFDVMTREEIESIRLRSRAKESGPWQTDYAEMAKKTVLRRHSKILPMQVEALDVIEAGDRHEFGELTQGDGGTYLEPPKADVTNFGGETAKPEPDARPPKRQRKAEEPAVTPTPKFDPVDLPPKPVTTQASGRTITITCNQTPPDEWLTELMALGLTAQDLDGKVWIGPETEAVRQAGEVINSFPWYEESRIGGAK